MKFILFNVLESKLFVCFHTFLFCTKAYETKYTIRYLSGMYSVEVVNAKNLTNTHNTQQNSTENTKK